MPWDTPLSPALTSPLAGGTNGGAPCLPLPGNWVSFADPEGLCRGIPPLSPVLTFPLAGGTINHKASPVRGAGSALLTRRGCAVGYPPVTCADIPPCRGDNKPQSLPCKGSWVSFADPEGLCRGIPPCHLR